MSDPSHFSGTLSTSAMSAYSLLPLQSLRANSFTVDNAAPDGSTFEQLLPTLLHHQPPVRQTSQTPLQPLIPTDMPIINNIENNSAASSWSSDSSPSGSSSSTDEWLTALPPVQTPSNSITASSASTSSRASPATLLPISYSASLFGNQANESSFYGSTCANTAPPFAFRANSTTESGSLPLMQSLAAASSHSSTAITASTAAAALSSSHSSSNSFKSNSLPPIPSPLSFPSTSTCSVSSSSSHSSSPLSPVSPSASFEEASSASRAKSRRQLNWRARLESQKRYDRKRRSTIRVLFESLRKILKSSQLVTKEVEKKIEESCGKSEDQKDENSAMVAKKKSKKRPKERNFDDFSTIDLVAAASTAIRHLNGMKEKLEKQLDELRTDDRTIDGAIDPNELEREFYYCKEEELEDWERRHRYTHMIDAEEMDSGDADEQHTPSPSTDIVLGRADSIASVSSPSACSPAAVDGLQFSKQFRSTSGVHLNELQSLLHAIHVLNLQYTIDMEAVRELENQLPKEVSDLATYFGGSFGILGMDGRVAMVLKVNSNHPAKKQFDRYFSQQYHAAHRRFRAPHIVQMHALAYVMGSGFKYQPFDEDEDQKFKDQDSKANFNEKFDTHNPFGDDGDDDDTAAEKRQPWSTAQIMQFLTNGMSRFSLSDSSASKSSAKDYRSHPLGSYALPPESFKLLVEVLGYLSNLDLAEYDRQWTQLSGIAAEIFPFPLFGWKMPIMAIKQMVFNPISKVTHAEAKGFYELYSGLKPIISMKRRKMFMNGELRYVDWDIMLIKHPESGLPLAHFTIPRALYSDAELQALEDRMYNNCPPELQEVMKIQQHQRQAQRQDTFPTATTTNPTAAKN